MVHAGDAPDLVGVRRLHRGHVAPADPGDLLPGWFLERLALLGLRSGFGHGRNLPHPFPGSIPFRRPVPVHASPISPSRSSRSGVPRSRTPPLHFSVSGQCRSGVLLATHASRSISPSTVNASPASPRRDASAIPSNYYARPDGVGPASPALRTTVRGIDLRGTSTGPTDVMVHRTGRPRPVGQPRVATRTARRRHRRTPYASPRVRGDDARSLDLRRSDARPVARIVSNLDTVRTMLACFSAGDPQGQLDHCTDDVVYEAPYYGLERHGKAELAAMLASVQERFDEVSYVIVDDFPTVDPDLVIVEVRGDNRVPWGERRYQNHYIMFLYFRDDLVPAGGSSPIPTSTERRCLHDGCARRPVLEGIDVLDLSTGIAGPMTGMLLADHGARVTKIEPPGGDPTRSLSGAQVWHRGKRSAVLDLQRRGRPRTVPRARVACRRRARELRPRHHHRARHRRRHAAPLNPRLVYCSITAYGDDGTARRTAPRLDALVAGAHRAPVGEPRRRPAARSAASPASRRRSPTSSCPTTAGSPRRAPARSSRACRGSAWPPAYLATLAISAALRVREQTGRGQRV